MSEGTTTRRGKARTWDRKDTDRWTRLTSGTSWNDLEAVFAGSHEKEHENSVNSSKICM